MPSTEVIPNQFFDPGRIGDVMAFLGKLPIAGRGKVEILQAWSRAVGAKVSAAQYNTVEASGIDNTRG